MRIWSAFFGCFWVGVAILTLIGIEVPLICTAGGCLLAAFYNFEELFR